MRKRKVIEEEEGSEMDVDDEEKVELLEPNEAEEDEDEEISGDEQDSDEDDSPQAPTMIENPFLDSFYGLSSDDGKERSKAAQIMLHHCLFSSSANAKDAAYALRRLLNGICSGRAAARQGNASALASFLKISFKLGKIAEIREEHSMDIGEDASALAYIRERVIRATDPNQTTGKKKGSEERDYQFGRLFGILAIVRSNILISSDSEAHSLPDTMEVASTLASDLAELFWLKRWMREPAAHGITTLIKLFYDRGTQKKNNGIAKRLVESVVIPKLLSLSSTGEKVESSHTDLVGSFCAEQLGIALFIQSQAKNSQEFPYPLDQPVLSSETVPLVAQALSETSVVVQPRTHFVWDTIWCYLSEPADKLATKRSPKAVQRRILRENCPMGDENATGVLDLLLREVMIQKLLGIEVAKGSSSVKATHERMALSLCMVKILSGVTHVSSMSGPTQIVLEAGILEDSVLSSDVVRVLFLGVICAGNEKKKTSHLLKPLALDVLGAIADSVVDESSQSADTRRLAVAKALLNSELRFDARTKTSTVADLLGLMQPIQEGKIKESFSFLDGYIEYLESNLLSACSEITDGDLSARATGYVELLYSAAKLILRLESESDADKSSLKEYKDSTMKRALRFFMASAFFQCEDVQDLSNKGGKKKKGKKNKKENSNPMLNVALKAKEQGAPFVVRSVISARFFSLLADFSVYATHTNADDQDSKIEKDTITLSILTAICDDWKAMEKLGAKRFSSTSKEEDSKEDAIDPENLVNDMRSIVDSCGNSTESMNESKKRCCTGIAVLGVSLYIHRLSCGQNDLDNDDPDADDENDEEEICNALEGLKDIAEDFLDDADEETNPLLGLAELCANILSSPLGSGNMGRSASPKLVRETVKFAWLGGLRMSSSMASKEQSLLDSSVVRVLLEAIGAASRDETEENGSDGEDSEDEEDNNDSDDSGDENVFTKATMEIDDPEDMSAKDEEGNEDAENDNDVELDPTKLQSLLEEDSDDIEDIVLEHHEGADAALAKLIRLKQDARKAGQQARERVEISHQLRCTFLLELLFGRSDSWNRIFQGEVLASLLLPMLKHRKKIEKSLLKSTEGASKSGYGEKVALLAKLTSLLKQKLCKMKLASMPLAKSLSTEVASDLTSQIITEAKRSDSNEHGSCCNSCLVFVLRSTGDALSVASMYADAVVDWSTKRTTKLQANLFDDLIMHAPKLAQAVLVAPLCQASTNARSPFLKAEAFRLLSLVFGVQSNTEGNNETDEAAVKSLESVRGDFLSSVEGALEDEEMRKAKRVRVILKAFEKFVDGLSSPAGSKTYSSLEKVKELLDKLSESESQGIQTACAKAITELDTKVEGLRASDKKKEQSSPAGESETSKAKKNKKKKKKR